MKVLNHSFMNIKKSLRMKSNKLWVILIPIFIILLTNIFNFIGWETLPIMKNIRYAILFLLPIVSLFVYNKTKCKSVMYNRKMVLYYIAVCLFTFFLQVVLFGANYGKSLETNLFVAFVFCCYILFHYTKMSEDILLKGITCVGLIVFLIQVFQQLNPQMAIFGVFTEEMKEETGVGDNFIASMRNGLYRFKLITAQLPLLLFCCYFSKMLSKFKYTYILLVCIFAASLYLMLTRMFMICMVICAIYIYLSQRKQIKSKFAIAILVIIACAGLVTYSDALFANLFDSKESDIEYSGSARINCLPFIWLQAASNPILFFIGHGYDQALWKWGFGLGYWWNDLGVLGQVYTYGIIWVLIYCKITYNLLVKLKKIIPIYIRGYVFGCLCICYMMPSYASNLTQTLLWCVVLYISDLYISNSRKIINNAV